MARLRVVAAVIDGAKQRPSRPLSEFVVRPAWPIREMYLDRFLINLVWFARNYLNFILIWAASASIYYPLFVLCLAGAAAVHLTRTSAKVRMGFKFAQFLSCVYIYWEYGLLPPLLTALTPMLIIALHATFTPYTDDALTYYNSILSNCGEECAEPRTPVQTFFAKTDAQFAAAAAAKLPPLNLDEPSPPSAAAAAAAPSASPREGSSAAGAGGGASGTKRNFEKLALHPTSLNGSIRRITSGGAPTQAPQLNGAAAAAAAVLLENDVAATQEKPQLAVSTPAVVNASGFEQTVRMQQEASASPAGSPAAALRQYQQKAAEVMKTQSSANLAAVSGKAAPTSPSMCPPEKRAPPSRDSSLSPPPHEGGSIEI